MRFTIALMFAAAGFAQGKQNVVQTRMVDTRGANLPPGPAPPGLD